MAYDYNNREKILAKSSGFCAYCGDDLSQYRYWHRDHILPRSKGGGHDLENLAASCARCNVRKGSSDAQQFSEWIIDKFMKATTEMFDTASDLVEYLPSDDADFIIDQIIQIFNRLDETHVLFFLDELQKDWRNGTRKDAQQNSQSQPPA